MPWYIYPASKKENKSTVIEKKVIKTPLGLQREYYCQHEPYREFRRVIGGLGWPSGEQQGFVCVAGESDHKVARLNLRKIWLLAEYESGNIEKLIKRVYDLQNKYLVKSWYSDTENVLMMHFVDRFNSKLSKKKKGIYIAEAPFIGETHNLRVYAHQIKGRSRPEKKSLHFGSNSRIPGVLSSLSPDDVQKKKAEDFPAIAALGYVLSGLDEPYCDISGDREIHEQFMAQRCVEGL